jgi:hypothetical protein
MPWFPVDDGFHAHRKAAKAGVEAVGLWTLAGSWSASELTDGWIPDYIAQRLDPRWRRNAAKLVAAGLWIAEERSGEKGWQFHEWAEEGRNPTAETVRAKRAEARERMRRVRENRQNGSQVVRANTERTDSERHAKFAQPPAPSVLTEHSNARAARSERDPAEADPDFERFWDAYPRKRAKGAARKAWAKAAKTTDPDLIIKAAHEYAHQRKHQDTRYTAHPATWLNAECWTDQPETSNTPGQAMETTAGWDV